MIDILFKPKISWWRYCLLISALAIPISIFLTYACEYITHLIGFYPKAYMSTVNQNGNALNSFGIVEAVIISPIIETFLLALLIKIVSFFIKKNIYIATLSAVIWGAVHGLFGLVWFFGPAWGFFILSCGYLGWEKKGFWRAFSICLVPHIFNNIIGSLVVYFGKSGF